LGIGGFFSGIWNSIFGGGGGLPYEGLGWDGSSPEASSLSLQWKPNIIDIVIDPGHGDYVFNGQGAYSFQSGALGIGNSPFSEHDYALDLALKVGKGLDELERYKVTYTRKSIMLDPQPYLKWRTEFSNKVGGDAFFSFHINSYDPEVINYFMACYYTRSGKVMADSIAQSVREGNFFSSSNSYGEAFYVLKNSKAPAVLIEAGNIKCVNNAQIITNPQFIDALVRGIDAGIQNLYGERVKK